MTWGKGGAPRSPRGKGNNLLSSHCFLAMSAFDTRMYGSTASREMSRIDYQVLSANYQALREELASIWQRYEVLSQSYNELKVENKSLRMKNGMPEVAPTVIDPVAPLWAIPQTITPRHSFESGVEDGPKKSVRFEADVPIKRPLDLAAFHEASDSTEPRKQQPPKKRTKICEQCGEGFPDNWKLNRHITRKHK